MTISSEICKVLYEGDGVSERFAVPFRFVREDDLSVVVRTAGGEEQELARGTDYVVERDEDNSGGTIDMLSIPKPGEVLSIRRDPAMLQETAYEEGVPLSAKAREDALDLLTMICQANRELVSRCLRFGAASSAQNVGLPEPEGSRALVWDEQGAQLVNGPSVADISLAGASLAQVFSARDEATAARDEATVVRDEILGAVASYRLPENPQDGDYLRYDGASSAWIGAPVQVSADLSGVIRSQNRGFAELAAQLSMPDVDFESRRLDTFEDLSNVDLAASSGFTHDDENDFVAPSAAASEVQADLALSGHADLSGTATLFTVDAADASGHFDAAPGAGVQPGCRILAGSSEVLVTAMSGDGTGAGEVSFSGVLAAGSHALTAIHATMTEEGALRLSGTSSYGTQDISTTANAHATDTRSGFSAGAAFDDDTGTQWSSATYGSAQVGSAVGQIWSEQRTVWKVRFQQGVYSVPSLKVQAYDGASWTDTGDAVSGVGDSNWHELVLAVPVACLGLRLAATAQNNVGFEWIMNEIEVFDVVSARPAQAWYTATCLALDAASVASVRSVELATQGGELRFAVSFDGGSAWKGWNGSAWEAVSYPCDGLGAWMDAQTLASLAEGDWPAPEGDIVLAVGLRAESAADDPTLSSVLWHVNGVDAPMTLVMAPVYTNAAAQGGAVWLASSMGDQPPTIELSRNGGANWDEVSLVRHAEFLGTLDTWEGEVAAFTHDAGEDDEIVARLSTLAGEPVEVHFLSVGGLL